MSFLGEQFAKSNILSGFIVILCIGTLCYMAIIQAPVPQILVDICLIVVSFFFGSKTATAEAVMRSQQRGE